jgi:hypothetical protein
MADPFASHAVGTDGPGMGSGVITPADGADLADVVRGITIGTAGGTITYVHARTGQTCTTADLPIGTYPIYARRVLATGTTATGLTGWI